MDRVHTMWAEIIKHLLDRTSPDIIFIWSGKVILGLGFVSPNITLPDQINTILVSVLSNTCIILVKFTVCFSSTETLKFVNIFNLTKGWRPCRPGISRIIYMGFRPGWVYVLTSCTFIQHSGQKVVIVVESMINKLLNDV